MNDLRPGQEIHGYRILRELGRGGMGAVFEVDSQGHRFALKLLSTRDSASIQRFLREAQLLARVDRHPNIVAIHAFGQSPFGPWFTMDYIQGQSLAEVLEDSGRLSPLQTRDIVLEITRALEFIHSRGITHRDLKAENILISHDGQVRLADFGIARALDSERLTQTGQAIGTPRAMAPELLCGEPAGPSADIWALGVLFHQCLTGEAPFKGNTPTELAAAIINSPVPKLPDRLPPAFQSLSRALLSAQPEQRPSASEVLQRLENMDFSPAPRISSGAALAIVSLVLAIAIAALLLFQSKKTPSAGPSRASLEAALSELQAKLLPELQALISTRIWQKICPQPAHQKLNIDSQLPQLQSILADFDQRLSRLPETLRNQLESDFSSNPKTRILRAARQINANTPWTGEWQALEEALNSPPDQVFKNLQSEPMISTLNIKILNLALAVQSSAPIQIDAILREIDAARPETAALILEAREHLAFCALTGPDYLAAWQSFQLSLPKSEREQRDQLAAAWNRRIERDLAKLDTERALQAWFAWRRLASANPALSLPLASPDVHRAIAARLRSDPELDRFQSPTIAFCHDYLADPRSNLLTSMALGLGGISTRSSPLSLSQASELLDIILLLARKKYLFGSPEMFSHFPGKELWETRKLSSRDKSEAALVQALQSTVEAQELAKGELRNSALTQCLRDFQSSLNSLMEDPRFNHAEACLRGAQFSLLAEAGGRVSASSRSALWQSLDIDKPIALAQWLSIQSRRINKNGSPEPDVLIRDVLVTFDTLIRPAITEPDQISQLDIVSRELFRDWLAAIQQRFHGWLEGQSDGSSKNILIAPIEAPIHLASVSLVSITLALELATTAGPKSALEILAELRNNRELDFTSGEGPSWLKLCTTIEIVLKNESPEQRAAALQSLRDRLGASSQNKDRSIRLFVHRLRNFESWAQSQK